MQLELPDFVGVLTLADDLAEHADETQTKALLEQFVEVSKDKYNTVVISAAVHLLAKLVAWDMKRNDLEYSVLLEFAICMLIHRGASAYRDALKAH